VTAPAARSTHVTGLFPELLGVGGVQEAGRLTSLAVQQIARRRGWSTTFAGLNDPLGPHEFSIDANAVALQGFARAKSKFIRAAIRSARAAHGANHIIIAGHPNLAPIAVWLQKMSPRARSVVMAHGVEVWQPLPLVRRASIRAAHLVTGPSADTIRRLTDVQHVASSRTRLLPWPLNPDFLRLTTRTDLPLPEGVPQGRLILTIGRAAASEQYKGTDDLICAVAQLQSEMLDLHLISVGAGDDLARLQKVASESGASRRVHFLQRLSREELAACYARADLFAMPSAGEGFGIVFLEAMSFGKPLIAAACGGALDLVQDGVNGLLVPPRDLSALTAAVSRLLQNESLCSALGANGAAMVQEKYRFDTFETNVERLLEECAA
jgi:glycosyltransferase involved in cell wall biosynthesis